jgi:hypothetical protein
VQAVTRVKLEQASKVMMWMPTRLKNGEGRAGREGTNKHLFRSTGVVSTACREGDLSQWGDTRGWWRSRLQMWSEGATASLGVGEGYMTVEAG